MAEFDGTIRFQKIDSAQGHPLLRDFTCGDATHGDAVDELVRRQYAGEAVYRPTILAMADSSYEPVRTIGLCAWRPRTLPEFRSMWRRHSDLYIHVLGIGQDYRECWLPGDISLELTDGTSFELPSGRSLGHALLGGALQHIARDQSPKLWRRSPMPAVWGFVHPENEKAHSLSESYGFRLRKTTKGFVVRFRPRHLPA